MAQTSLLFLASPLHVLWSSLGALEATTIRWGDDDGTDHPIHTHTHPHETRKAHLIRGRVGGPRSRSYPPRPRTVQWRRDVAPVPPMASQQEPTRPGQGWLSGERPLLDGGESLPWPSAPTGAAHPIRRFMPRPGQSTVSGHNLALLTSRAMTATGQFTAARHPSFP